MAAPLRRRVPVGARPRGALWRGWGGERASESRGAGGGWGVGGGDGKGGEWGLGAKRASEAARQGGGGGRRITHCAVCGRRPTAGRRPARALPGAGRPASRFGPPRDYAAAAAPQPLVFAVGAMQLPSDRESPY